jgi:hypothetical protein
MTKLHTKSALAALTLAVILGVVPAFGQVKVVIAGSSALFNAVGLGAYNGPASGAGNQGTCPADGVAPCSHWTGKTDLVLQDTRVSPANNDAAKIFVVWDSSTVSGGPNIWVYANVDSVVGDRCFFAVPACEIVDTSGSNAGWTATGAGLISSTLWGTDVAMPAPVLAIVEAPGNVKVNVAATDIRPEDAWFAVNRVNSILGPSSIGSVNSASDGLDGLGYNANNASGQAANYVTSTTGTCTALTNPKAIGTQIYSAFQHTATSTDAANVLAFNIIGKDPITCTAIPTYAVKSVGLDPVVFVFSRTGALAGLQNATEAQLQQVFSGKNTNASAFGLAAGNINAFLREPLSGTMNTTEASVFRYPTLYSTNTALAQSVVGVSQEFGVGTPTAGSKSNPLFLDDANGVSCEGGGSVSCRFRAIGTGEEVNSVACSSSAYSANTAACGSTPAASNNNVVDGIGYAFYSYGNVANLGDNANYGYVTLDGIDPVWTSYQPFVGAGDPGQPNPASYGGALGILAKNGENTLSFPQCENALWKGGYSYPNVRNGLYRAWSILRLAYGTAQATPVTDLITASNKFVVTSTPDYIPFAAVSIAANGACGTKAFAEPGVKVWRSHYQQLDGEDRPLGKAPVNTDTADVGGDMGGAILIYEATLGLPDTTTQVTSGSNANNVSPYLRPAK